MTKQEQIALNYISQHKNANLDDWLLQNGSLSAIYAKLENGVFGEAREIDGYPGEYEIEIRASESSTGHPIIFTWEAP